MHKPRLGSRYYFMVEVAHSGDKAESYNNEVERFDHYLRTWASWQHSAFLIQAVSCSMAQAAHYAMVVQSKKDLTTESGGRSAFQSHGHPAGVLPPSPAITGHGIVLANLGFLRVLYYCNRLAPS